MKHSTPLFVLCAGMFAPAPVLAVPGGAIDTLPLGHYVCSIQGDATGAARVHVPEADFKVRISSSYDVGEQRGAYVKLGDRVTMTSGAFAGTQFRIDSSGFLQRLGDDGSDDPISCSRGLPPDNEIAENCPEPAEG